MSDRCARCGRDWKAVVHSERWVDTFDHRFVDEPESLFDLQDQDTVPEACVVDVVAL